MAIRIKLTKEEIRQRRNEASRRWYAAHKAKKTKAPAAKKVKLVLSKKAKTVKNVKRTKAATVEDEEKIQENEKQLIEIPVDPTKLTKVPAGSVTADDDILGDDSDDGEDETGEDTFDTEDEFEDSSDEDDEEGLTAEERDERRERRIEREDEDYQEDYLAGRADMMREMGEMGYGEEN